jgi:hypothetical protein
MSSESRAANFERAVELLSFDDSKTKTQKTVNLSEAVNCYNKAVGDTVMPRLSYNSDVEKLLINVIKTLKKVKASDNRSRNKAPAIKCLDSLMQKIIDDFLEC